jgi:hypothetical protein
MRNDRIGGANHLWLEAIAHAIERLTQDNDLAGPTFVKIDWRSSKQKMVCEFGGRPSREGNEFKHLRVQVLPILSSYCEQSDELRGRLRYLLP